jgi:hypothetical protein
MNIVWNTLYAEQPTKCYTCNRTGHLSLYCPQESQAPISSPVKRSKIWANTPAKVSGGIRRQEIPITDTQSRDATRQTKAEWSLPAEMLHTTSNSPVSQNKFVTLDGNRKWTNRPLRTDVWAAPDSTPDCRTSRWLTVPPPRGRWAMLWGLFVH